jgi:hypothetical protein
MEISNDLPTGGAITRPSRAASAMSTRARSMLRWAAWGGLSVPLAVLSHEFAHFLAYVAFGFPGARLHFSSASFAGSTQFWQYVQAGDHAAAAAQLALWKVGVASIAGPILSYLSIALCLWLARRRLHPLLHPLVLAMLIVAPIRFLGSALVLFGNLMHRSMARGSDEAHAAALLPIPEGLLHVIGVALLIVAWVTVVKVTRREARGARFIALVLGVVGGGLLYALVIGPVLLP